MCGIVGCRTAGRADHYLLPALRSLEYRGYDSVGVAITAGDGSAVTLRSIKRVDDLASRVAAWEGAPLAGTGIGHTRWATHGGVSEVNAHPHHDCEGKVSVVHNGIIENSDVLRTALLAEGHRFDSSVDSEVICHLIEQRIAAGDDMRIAVQSALGRLSGSWALLIMQTSTGRLFAATHHAPLLVAASEHGIFVASDITAIAPWVTHFRVMADGDLVELGPAVRWFRDGTEVSPPPAVGLSWANTIRALGADDDDFMGREIAEQPETVERIVTRLGVSASDGSLWADLGLAPFHRVAVVGCGTSLNAGKVIAHSFGALGRVPNFAIVASEAGQAMLEPNTLVIAASQSGETADVLRALDELPARARSLLALTNSMHSTLARRSDAVLDCFAGPEVGVAATKTFVAQVVTGVCLALSSMVARGTIPRATAKAIIDDLRRAPERLDLALGMSKTLVPRLAASLTEAPGFLFLGRGAGVTYAAEGALKLKELTYRWAESYPAGELKHGPLALVESGTPVIVIDHGDPRLPANIAEVRSRGGRVIDIGGAGSMLPALGAQLEAPATEPDRGRLQRFGTPWGPLESVIPLQMLARELALALGRDVDKPRNLAKSVTVE